MSTPETPIDELSHDAANSTYSQVMPDEGGPSPLPGRSALQHLGLPGSGGGADLPDEQVAATPTKKRAGKAKAEADAAS